MTKKEWKKGFLSSSLPLEFETAKILVRNGFSFEPDYCYERIEAGQTKDFSVDLTGFILFPTSNPNEITASLDLLIECKYRTQNKTWVFLPDVNIPDLSLDRGTTIVAIDEFSFHRVSKDPLYLFDAKIPLCYKGTEIDLSNNTAHDSELRHGIIQLQYALPLLISSKILNAATSHPDDAYSSFIMSILITTAELRVLKRGTTLTAVENTDNLDDITKRVPYLNLFGPSSPDFVTHAKRYFKELTDVSKYKNVSTIEERLRASGEKVSKYRFPSAIGKGLSEGEGYRLGRYCSQFVVCSFDALQEMLNNAKQVVRACLRMRKSI